MNIGLGSRNRFRLSLGFLLLGLAALIHSPVALAQHRGGHHGAARGHHGVGVAPQRHGNIARFHEHDGGVWRGGHWVHDHHGGRLGWWWVAGGAWYLYPAPVYPYPNPWEPAPAVIGIPAVPPTPYWYYCDALQTYYPYTPDCPGGWREVPATPEPDVPTQPQ